MERACGLILFLLFLLQRTYRTEEVQNENICGDVPDGCSCQVKPPDVYIDCSGRQLHDIPNLGPNVTHLNLSQNEINQSISSKLSGYPNLVVLDLSHNKFTNLTTRTFAGLYSLKHLHLHHNYIRLSRSNFILNTFQDLINLEYIDMKHNIQVGTSCSECSYPDESFANLKALKVLRIDGLNHSIFGSGFQKLKNLTTLNLSGQTGVCHMEVLNNTRFINLNSLEVLDVSRCKILEIQSGTFSHLEHIEMLDISFNDELTFAVLLNVTEDIKSKPIKILKANSIYCTFGTGTAVFRRHFEKLKNNTNLEELHLDGNRIELFEQNVLMNLPKSIKLISIQDNRLSFGLYLFELPSLTNLETLYASDQNILHDPSLGKNRFVNCHNTYANNTKDESILIDGSTVVKYFEHNLSQFQKMTVTYSIPPKLKYFYANNSNINCNLLPFNLNGNNSLELIDVSKNVMTQWKGPFVGFPTLKYLFLSNVFGSKLNLHFFHSFPRIQCLDLRRNYLGLTILGDVGGEIFKNLTDVKEIDLAENQITDLSPNLFKSMTDLRKITLSENAISQWVCRINHMKKLKVLDLSSNQITRLSKQAMDDIDEILQSKSVSNQFTLNLRHNQILCSCDTLDFLTWIFQRKKHIEDYDHHHCFFTNGTRIGFDRLKKLIIQYEKYCSPYNWVIFGSSCIILMVLTLIIVAIVYRYRWKLRYVYYMTRNKYRKYNMINGSDDTIEYQYDAFISHSAEDNDFVVNEMLQHLEHNCGLSLCISSRDFFPGREIAANITNAINVSRKTVIVLTKNFLLSYWCMFELQMARMESVYTRSGRDVFVMIFLEKLPIRSLPLVVMEIVENDSYIEYPDNSENMEIFWERIKEELLH